MRRLGKILGIWEIREDWEDYEWLVPATSVLCITKYKSYPKKVVVWTLDTLLHYVITSRSRKSLCSIEIEIDL
jgi:hypothetical protein